MGFFFITKTQLLALRMGPIVVVKTALTKCNQLPRGALSLWRECSFLCKLAIGSSSSTDAQSIRQRLCLSLRVRASRSRSSQRARQARVQRSPYRSHLAPQARSSHMLITATGPHVFFAFSGLPPDPWTTQSYIKDSAPPHPAASDSQHLHFRKMTKTRTKSKCFKAPQPPRFLAYAPPTSSCNPHAMVSRTRGCRNRTLVARHNHSLSRCRRPLRRCRHGKWDKHLRSRSPSALITLTPWRSARAITCSSLSHRRHLMQLNLLNHPLYYPRAAQIASLLAFTTDPGVH